MGILDHIRNIVDGTTRSLQNKVEGRMLFMILFAITFGIIQLLWFLICLYGYIIFMDSNGSSFTDLLVDPNFFRLYYFIGYTAPIVNIFLAHMIWKNGGATASHLSFGKLFSQISFKTFVVYLICIPIILGMAIYLTDEGQLSLFDISNENPFSVIGSEEAFYVSLLKDLGLVFVRFSPSIIVGYYLVHLRNGDWKLDYLLKYWKNVVALIVVWTAFSLFFNFVWQLLSGVVMGVFTAAFKELYLPIFLNLIGYFFASVIGLYVTGYLGYFSVFSLDQDLHLKTGIREETSELLDQI